MNLNACHNIADLRAGAARALPAPIFHYMDGGADDELSLARATGAFADWEILPDTLVDVSSIDASTRLLGQKIEWPLMLSPTGMSRLFHRSAEPAAARAAAQSGVWYSLSTMATTSLEDIAAATHGPLMFQIYIFKDRGLTRDLVERCKAAGYEALCLTVDTPLAGNRERDKRLGMVMPPRFGADSFLSFIAHPRWSVSAALGPKFDLANVVGHVDSIAGRTTSVIGYVNSQFDRTVTWRDAERLAADWDGPLVIKGVLTPEDALRAAGAGATAIMLSGHGGRQLDTTPAPMDQLESVVAAVGDQLEVILDGGVRRGSDIFKALALGATACSIGRPYLYGLAAGGQEGVTRALTILRDEFERTMALAGVANLAAIRRTHVRRRG